MRLLIICQYYSPEPFKISELCNELSKFGHSITVLTGIPNYPEGKPYKGYGWFRKRKEIIKNIEIVRIPIVYRGKTRLQLFFNYVSFAVIGSLYALNLKRNFDEVLVYQLSPIFMAIPGIVYAKIHKKPLVMYTLDLWPESYFETEKSENRVFKRLLYTISKWIYISCSRIGVSSKGFIDSITGMGFSPGKIMYLPQYSEDPYPDMLIDEIRDDVNQEKSDVNIMFTGNVGVAQSLGIVLDAAEVTKRHGANIKWILVGEGRAKTKLVSECKRRKLDDVVEFRARISELDVVRLLRTADVALLALGKSSLFKRTVPAKLQTYMSCGLPILASVDGEAACIIEEAKCGFVSPAEDGNSLGLQALNFLKSSKEDRLLNSQNARDYYLKNFSKESHMQNMNELLLQKPE